MRLVQGEVLSRGGDTKSCKDGGDVGVMGTEEGYQYLAADMEVKDSTHKLKYIVSAF
jgi:hypothetical protein